MNKRICEKYKGTYGTGKEYGGYWCEVYEIDPITKDPYEIKGLCEFCNPQHISFIPYDQDCKFRNSRK